MTYAFQSISPDNGQTGFRRHIRHGLLALVPLAAFALSSGTAEANPDLVVTDFRPLGDVVRAPRGDGFQVRVSITVRNRGTRTARRAKIAAFATRLPNTGLVNVPLATVKPPNPLYAWTSALRPRGRQRLTGTITLRPAFTGARVRLNVVVDSTDGEEFANRNGRVLESNERNNRSASIVVNVPGKVDSISGLGDKGDFRPPDKFSDRGKFPGQNRFEATPPRSTPEKWAINLKRFVVWRNGERSGDEPMLFPLVFRARIGDGNSARVYMDPAPIRMGNSLRSGDIVRIPSVGRGYKRYRFDNVRRLTNYDVYTLNMLPEVYGVVFVAVEHNATPVGRVLDMIGNARREMIRALNGLMVSFNPAATLARSIARIQRQLTPSVGQAVGIAIESGFDADRLVGVRTVSFLGIDTDNPPSGLLRLLPGLPQALARREFSWNSRPHSAITFQKRPAIFPEDRRRNWKLEISVTPAVFYGRGTI